MSNLAEREKEIERFNEQSKWLKQGISIVPSMYSVTVVPTATTMCIFHIGSVIVEVGGVEMGQGLYTKVRQAVAYSLSPLWNKIREKMLTWFQRFGSFNKTH